jgi:hypothetical protein
MTPWKKGLLIGAGFGAGGALTATLVIVASVWYSSLPKAWDDGGVRATFNTFSVNIINNKEITGMDLDYVLENRSRYDYTVTPDQRFMLVDGGALRTSVTGAYKISEVCFIPAGNKVQCKITVPVEFDTTAKMGGFVVFDESKRYKITFPAPTRPTPDDRKRMLTQFTIAKQEGSQ